MGKVYAFVANGSEEVELLAVVDVLLRGGQDVKLVSITGSKDVVSAHQIKLQADLEFSEADFSDADVLFLPGGMPGTRNLAAHEGLCGELLKADKAGKRLAAICAGVVTDGNVTTARGLGYALDLGIELLALLTDREHAGQIKDSIQYDQIPM